MIETVGEFLANSHKIYLFVAIAGTTIFVIQFLMSVAGIHGGEVDLDGDIDVHDVSDIHGLNFFSLKSLVAFVTFFGWGGYFFAHLGWGGFAVAVLSGGVMMVLTALVIWLLLKMQQSGNVSDAELIGCSGTVYLTIPDHRAPGGIVTVALPDRTRQVSARADFEIKTGVDVVIEQSLGGGVFLVRKQPRQ